MSKPIDPSGRYALMSDLKKAEARVQELEISESSLARQVVEAQTRVQELERERDILFKGDWAALNLRAECAEELAEQRATYAHEQAARMGELTRRAERAEAEASKLREALAAYRSALRSGESETPQLRAIGDAALSEEPR